MMIVSPNDILFFLSCEILNFLHQFFLSSDFLIHLFFLLFHYTLNISLNICLTNRSLKDFIILFQFYNYLLKSPFVTPVQLLLLNLFLLNYISSLLRGCSHVQRVVQFSKSEVFIFTFIMKTIAESRGISRDGLLFFLSFQAHSQIMLVPVKTVAILSVETLFHHFRSRKNWLSELQRLKIQLSLNVYFSL